MSMTVKEAIAIIEDVTWNGCGRHYGKIPVAREMAILALEEVQKYRAIGTVSEFRELKEKATAKVSFGIKCSYCGFYTRSKGVYCGNCGMMMIAKSEGKE